MTVGMCVNPEGPFGVIDASTMLRSFRSVNATERIDHRAIVGPRAHRTGPDDVGKRGGVRADQVSQLVGTIRLG